MPGDGADSVDGYNEDPDAADDAFEEGIDDIEDDICEDEGKKSFHTHQKISSPKATPI